MPELPEVQTVVNDLIDLGLCGRTIVKAKVHWPRCISGSEAESFCKSVQARRICKVSRRAKFIVLQMDCEQWLVIHLRMTGRFILKKTQKKISKHIHAEFFLDDQRRLQYHDTRKFGRFYLVKNPDEFFREYGPEPLEKGFTVDALVQIVNHRRRQLKPLLLDQKVIAGLGNIYVDEALWKAKLHPVQRAENLTLSQIRTLHRAIRAVLKKAIQNNGTTLGKGENNFSSATGGRGRNANHLNVFRRTGHQCLRCRCCIIKIIVAQRSTHICPSCQRLGQLS
ncbi:MAG: DNA-formamidopyrimidine glycosylase [Desulfobacteraceae bacterium]|nr:DNA-formamidopyrimidine glycosylase [Desulfobacteraceae bacterium]